MDNPRPETFLSVRAQGLRIRAEECWQLSEMVQHADAKRIYRQFALGYERLADHADTIRDYQAAFRQVMSE